MGNLAIEIKGQKPNSLEQEKCEALCEQEGQPVLLISGDPWPDDYEAQLYYSDYNVYQCSWCGKLFSWDEELYCPNCDNSQMFEPYEPSKFVNLSSAHFGEISEDGLDHILLPSLYVTSLYTRPNESSLYFAYQLASRAHFEYLQSFTPRLYQGDCSLFNPAFGTQDWDHAGLIYNAMPEIITMDNAKWIVGTGVTPLAIKSWFDTAILAVQADKWAFICDQLSDSLGKLKDVLDGFKYLFPVDADCFIGYSSTLSQFIDYLACLREIEPDLWVCPRRLTYCAIWGMAYENIVYLYSQIKEESD